MHIVVLSIHPLWDNRIYKHIYTLLNYGYEVSYINASSYSKSGFEDFSGKKFSLTHSCQRKNFNSSILLFLKVLIWFVVKIFTVRKGRIYHIHDLLLLPLVPLIKMRKGVVVFDIHEYYEHKTLHGIKKNYISLISKKIFYPLIDGFVYVSPEMLNLAKLVAPVKIIPNYQLKTYYDNIQINKDKEEIAMVYFGPLNKDRCLKLMLNIIEYVLERHDKTSAYLGGPIEDSLVHEAQNIKQLADKYSGRFNYLGVVPYKEVARITKNSDIGLWFLKKYMGYQVSPNKVYEYLMCGLAVFGLKGNSISSFVEEKGAGIGFDLNTDSYEYIAKTVLSIINNRQRLEAMKMNSKKLGKRYNWESVEHLYVELYEVIIRK